MRSGSSLAAHSYKRQGRRLSNSQWLWVVCLLIAVALAHGNAGAQESESRLTIHLVDLTGAVIPGATVLVRSQTSSAVQSAKSGGGGDASMSLAPGQYEVVIEATRFQTWRRMLVLGAGEHPEWKASLELIREPEVVYLPTPTDVQRSVSFDESELIQVRAIRLASPDRGIDSWVRWLAGHVAIAVAGR